jgi:hypothetical protein
LAKVLEHDLRVGAGVGDFVDLCNRSGGIDQERDALRVERIWLVRLALDAIGATDALIGVTQQPEPELFVRGEDVVVGGRVERGSDDLDAELVELWASITEALAFAGSTASRGLGVPPQHDPRTAQVAELDNVVVLVG